MLIEARGIEKVYSTGSVAVKALKNVNVEIERGEFLAIMGPSGSGKSTFMNLLGCLDKPSGGVYLLDGEEIDQKSDDEMADIRNKYIGFIFQSFNLLPKLSALDNVMLPLIYRGTPVRERLEMAKEALRAVGLSDREKHLPSELSGGQQQRVALARALVNEPKVLLLDEPLGALDLKLRKEMQFELKHLQNQIDITFIYVTHDQEEALTMSDRIAVLNEGQVLQVDTPVNVYEKPTTRFVAEFIGKMNFLAGRVLQRYDHTVEIALEDQTLPLTAERDFSPGQAVTVALRPEKIHLHSIGQSLQTETQLVLHAVVQESVYAGTDTQYIVRLDSGERMIVHVRNAQAFPPDEFAQGREVLLSCPREALRLLPD